VQDESGWAVYHDEVELRFRFYEDEKAARDFTKVMNWGEADRQRHNGLPDDPSDG
jgi:hypothetical protein